jgi:pilus assembly protein Flp/PilA
MSRLRTLVRNFARDEEGASLIEYALLAALLAVAVVAAINGLANKVNTSLNNAASAIP